MMDEAAIKAILARDAERVETYLTNQGPQGNPLQGLEIPQGLADAVAYSLMAGGKRLRPALCLSFTRLFAGDDEKALPFAAGIECIHTYSLIHDDLPAMDNDDFRRGKPSCHKQFDEATAILAGDALLTDAFFLMSSCAESLPAERVLQAINRMALAAGSAGMVGGQFLDMQYTGKQSIPLAALREMHAMKTGALLQASCLCGALLAGAENEELKKVAAYGRALGAAFQIADDILDETGDAAAMGKPVGSDSANGKITYPSLLGLDESRRLAEEEHQNAVSALEPYAHHAECAFLQGLAAYVVQRVQ